MCFPVTGHKHDCGCSACLLRQEENRKWQRMLKNPTLRKRLDAELAVSNHAGWQDGYAEAVKTAPRPAVYRW
jgi:hypothetical protein